MSHLVIDTPLGPLTVFEDDGAVVALEWGRAPATGPSPLLFGAAAQLEAYFAGSLTVFDLPLDPAGTPFQKRVWTQLTEIPYGCTRSYGEVARALGSAPRSVGGACGRNPIAVIIPCHRVVGTGGGLVGYSGGEGIATKRALLRLEGATTADPHFFGRRRPA